MEVTVDDLIAAYDDFVAAAAAAAPVLEGRRAVDQEVRGFTRLRGTKTLLARWNDHFFPLITSKVGWSSSDAMA